MEIKQYKKAVRYLESLSWKSINKYGHKGNKSIFIKRMEFFLKLLGNPERLFKYVHIAGTSGKGSVALMIASILATTGAKTGVFISPFLTTTTERIGVDGQLIPIKEFIRLTAYLKPFMDKCAKDGPYGQPSYFETMLAMALLYFKKQKCKYVVLEAGIGGSFDATNIVKKPKVCLITNIGLDHTRILGRTRKEIALDKSGIIKKGASFLTGEKDARLKSIFKRICLQKGAKYKKIELGSNILKSDLSGLDFKYGRNIYKTKFIGSHQVRNSILAIEVTRCLKVKEADIAKGLSSLHLPGRLEIMRTDPLVILDGAHNPDKMLSVVNFLKKLKTDKLHLLITIAKNKDIKAIFKKIIPLSDKVFLTGFSSKKRHSLKEAELKKAARSAGAKNIRFFPDPKKALKELLKNASDNDLILITGSSHLSGKLREHWYPEKFILEKRKMK